MTTRDSDAPPLVLDHCIVTSYAFTSGLPFHTGAELRRVPRLAIGCSVHHPEVLLLFCDERWKTVRVSAHPSVADAKRRAEAAYAGVEWVERPVSAEQASEYLDTMWKDEKCSFCGRRPDQIAQIVQHGTARICDLCVREFHARIASEESQHDA
jgi:hypothetical protein